VFVRLPTPLRISTASVYAAVLAALCLACPALGQGVIFVDDDATGANDGSSWCDAYVYLQDALDAARNSGGSVAEIRVAKGTYRPDRGAAQIPGDQWSTFELISGVVIRGGYAGCWAPDPDERNIELYETILSGDLNGDDDTTLRSDSNCCYAEMRDTPGCDDPVCQEQVCLGIEGCCEDYWRRSCGNWAENVCCELCRPTRCENSLHVVTATDVEPTTVLDGFTVTGGERRGASAYRGAGLSSQGGSPTITNCRFVENAPDAMFTFRGEPRITNCDFIDNGWYGLGSGWALYNLMNEVEIRNCRFIRNRGGALRTEGSKPIAGCTFVQNTGYGSLYLGRGAPTISDCTFIGNEGYYGGGMLNNSGFPQLVNCGFYGNSASIFGGGLDTAGSVILINCVFSGNRAGGFVAYPGALPQPGSGGAVEQGLGSVLALGCTFVGNSAGYAGAMTGAGRADIAQCVFWENTCTQWNCGGAQVFGPAYFIEHSWIGGADPLFVDADGADDTVGTEDDNLRLSADSPLINAGDPDPPLVPYLDADGHERILCGRVDIGAYEFGIGDHDCNRVVELVDFAAWHTCMTGPDNGPFDSGCEAFDFDASAVGDIDLKDFAGFQLTLPAKEQR